MKVGLDASFTDDENGMTLKDMRACTRVADRHDEVIIFRSTGPWSLRWIEDGFPTKNFHVKGKSSDWGPMAGLVPYDGRWSKVGHDRDKAAVGTHKNDDGLASGFTEKTALVLTEAQISRQLKLPAGNPKRVAVDRRDVLKNGDQLLSATRPGDKSVWHFIAKRRTDGSFTIVAPDPDDRRSSNVHVLRDLALRGVHLPALEVMTSNEVGAGTPLTGDYDLMAICPSWRDYGSQSTNAIWKPALQMRSMPSGSKPTKGVRFESGTSMDKVLDQRLHTMSKVSSRTSHGKLKQSWDEHDDMGNLTPRLLRTINALNGEMPNGTGPFRRVHHNAESHRNRRFGAITHDEMSEKNEGFPLTIFQPRHLAQGAMLRWGQVCTLHRFNEFTEYASALHEAGYYLPKNSVWGMGRLWESRGQKISGLFPRKPR